VNRDVASALHEVIARGEAAALATVVRIVGSAPQRVGAALLVRTDGSFVGTIGGGVVEARVLEDARARIGAGRGEIVTYRLTQELGMCCGGTMEVFVTPVRPAPRLVLFGGGHVARPTAALAARCGFDVVVVDARVEWASRERFPDAREIVNEEFEDWLAGARFGPDDYLVIATPSHEMDQEVLLAVAAHDTAFVGMIGSRRKATRALQRLTQAGVPEERRARVQSPIGLDIGADSPDEIAVSIVAQLIQARAVREQRKHAAGGQALAKVG
jgi:xanthine dehydrogenase accessory factor